MSSGKFATNKGHSDNSAMVKDTVTGSPSCLHTDTDSGTSIDTHADTVSDSSINPHMDTVSDTPIEPHTDTISVTPVGPHIDSASGPTNNPDKDTVPETPIEPRSKHVSKSDASGDARQTTITSTGEDAGDWLLYCKYGIFLYQRLGRFVVDNKIALPL